MAATDTSLDPDSVTDRASFVQFVSKLIADRKAAERAEKSSPERYRLGGANDWQNNTISSFLECALAGSEAQPDWGRGDVPGWRDLALFLYLGKIYE